MDPKAKIKAELTTAMKAKDTFRTSVLRMIHAELQKKEIDKRSPLTEEEFIKMASTMIKQRKESIDQFNKGDRADLAAKEEAELKLIEEFLPEQLSQEELESIVVNAIKETGASSAKDMGKVMQAVMVKATGRADGKLIIQVVRAKLPA